MTGVSQTVRSAHEYLPAVLCRLWNVVVKTEINPKPAAKNRRNTMPREVVSTIRYCPLLLACAGFGLLPSANAQKTAHIDSPIASPIFVNLYWDSAWDTDNPGMVKASLDAITQAVVNSSYFKGLSEYGVTSASFEGGFLPEPTCPSKAPNSVGFYDPVNTSIAGFVQCEHDNGPAILRQNSVIYNVILPPSSTESDFWSSNFCSGPGSPIAWHYHGLEDSFPNVFGGPPIYTIVMSNPKCGGNSSLVPTLTHEMVEATTDPYPIDISIIPPHANIATENEIADFCEGQNAAIFVDDSNQTALFTQVGVTTYWSNAMQKCVSFTDTTTPTINNVTITNWGSQTQVAASGSGFGTMPGQISLPSPVLPYIEVVDHAHGWAAGDAINGDSVQLSIPTWSNTQVSQVGFVVPNGVVVNNVPSASLLAWVCNPNSLRCSSNTTTAAVGPFNPRLLILEIVAGDYVNQPHTFVVLENGTTLMTNTVNSNCQSACVYQSLQTLNPATYSITQQVTGSGVKTLANTCAQITLSLGEETSCRISDSGPSDPNSGCPAGYKCCEPGINKCSKCVSPKLSCP